MIVEPPRSLWYRRSAHRRLLPFRSRLDDVGQVIDAHNRTVLGFTTKTGKAAPPSRAEKYRRLSSRRYRFANGKRNLHAAL